MILLVGIPSETPLAMVARALAERGAGFVVVNQREVATNRIRLRLDRSGLSGNLSTGGLTIPLESVCGAYLRPMDDRRLPEVVNEPEGSILRERARSFHELLVQWSEVTEATVINRYSRMGSNSSKPYQAQLIAEAGFDVPETLITNDPEAVLAFRESHNHVIFKSVSSERSVVQLLTDNDLTRLDRVRHCPVQFQEYIPGQDIRVHTIGHQAFATAIESTGVDYRYAARRAGTTPSLTPTNLPDNVIDRCLALTSSLGLEFAGLDLRRDPAGRMVCFEINPSPAFSYYEAHTGQPIARAVATHLAVAQPAGSTGTLAVAARVSRGGGA